MKGNNNWMNIWEPDDEMLERIARLTINNNSSDFDNFWDNDVEMENADDQYDDMDVDYPDSDNQFDVLDTMYVSSLPTTKKVLYNKYTEKKRQLEKKRLENERSEQRRSINKKLEEKILEKKKIEIMKQSIFATQYSSNKYKSNELNELSELNESMSSESDDSNLSTISKRLKKLKINSTEHPHKTFIFKERQNNKHLKFVPHHRPMKDRVFRSLRAVGQMDRTDNEVTYKSKIPETRGFARERNTFPKRLEPDNFMLSNRLDQLNSYNIDAEKTNREKTNRGKTNRGKTNNRYTYLSSTKKTKPPDMVEELNNPNNFSSYDDTLRYLGFMQ